MNRKKRTRLCKRSKGITRYASHLKKDKQREKGFSFFFYFITHKKVTYEGNKKKSKRYANDSLAEFFASTVTPDNKMCRYVQMQG